MRRPDPAATAARLAMTAPLVIQVRQHQRAMRNPNYGADVIREIVDRELDKLEMEQARVEQQERELQYQTTRREHGTNE